MRVRYFQKISRISIREFNWEVMVTSEFDPSCRYNASSNINEVIRDNFRPFFTKRFYTHKMQTSDFHSDVFIRPESIKKQTSNFHS